MKSRSLLTRGAFGPATLSCMAATLGLAIAFAAAAPGSAAGADSNRPAATGKERLSDKASDEQRVDDCKVPQARRTKARPADCPWDGRS